tara:strand:+ start:38 stop:199 length:162 start_codon:yes stop_codon:yes gene_type:complete
VIADTGGAINAQKPFQHSAGLACDIDNPGFTARDMSLQSGNVAFAVSGNPVKD